MGPTLINGLPAHILLVHVVVILVPLTALALVAVAVRPAWIKRLGWLLPVLALVTLVSVPLTTHAGEWLEKHTDSDPLVRRHAELGDTLLPWVLGLFVVTVAVWWLDRRTPASTAAAATGDQQGAAQGLLARVPVRVTVIVLALVVAVGAVVQVYRIGDSGAKAAWHDNFSAHPVSHH
ncbi:DUF2231 domain-containing protein [Actinacidiphila guanduensis]|uniref:DUF2231 domain-containing protein n=1 Tax=Actinacidiphila guanduensis TaxID=310781 RepID=A0A1G9WH24_9ACTN|nr:DUF2231 domain-containing protein [Actinacidiphila guanduensis]SDM83355.1 hypothetical protein SAMN05216259_101636 [Actinacidiphila guanduensis]